MLQLFHGQNRVKNDQLGPPQKFRAVGKTADRIERRRKAEFVSGHFPRMQITYANSLIPQKLCASEHVAFDSAHNTEIAADVNDVLHRILR